MGLFEILEPIKYKDTRSQYHTISMAGSVLLASTDTENQVRFTKFIAKFFVSTSLLLFKHLFNDDDVRSYRSQGIV